MELVFSTAQGEQDKHLKLTTGPADPLRKSGSMWIMAMQQVFQDFEIQFNFSQSLMMFVHNYCSSFIFQALKLIYSMDNN